jgi:hypothetical protein
VRKSLVVELDLSMCSTQSFEVHAELGMLVVPSCDNFCIQALWCI